MDWKLSLICKKAVDEFQEVPHNLISLLLTNKTI